MTTQQAPNAQFSRALIGSWVDYIAGNEIPRPPDDPLPYQREIGDASTRKVFDCLTENVKGLGPDKQTANIARLSGVEGSSIPELAARLIQRAELKSGASSSIDRVIVRDVQRGKAAFEGLAAEHDVQGESGEFYPIQDETALGRTARGAAAQVATISDVKTEIKWVRL